jgi:hypothetical protein
MHAGLLTPVVPDAGADIARADLTITMLDGDLGAVTDPSGTTVLPRAEEVCWCGCIVCLAPPSMQVDGESR